MRTLAVAALVVLAASPSRQEQDADALLAAARQAMGGDAALAAIQSFSVTGGETQDLGPVARDRSLEIHYQRPDKYLRITRSTFNDPFGGGFTMTMRTGFNGPVRILSVVAPGAPMPVFIPTNEPRTPDQEKALEEAMMARQRQEFARLMLPLFAASPEAYPLTFRADAGTVVATGADGAQMRLFFDAATARPARLSWMAEPIVTMTTSGTIKTNARGEVMSESGFIPRPPAIPQTKVEWSTTFDDYRTDNGVTWPRRLRTSIAGKRHEEVRLNKYRINPRIDLSIFEPGK